MASKGQMPDNDDRWAFVFQNPKFKDYVAEMVFSSWSTAPRSSLSFAMMRRCSFIGGIGTRVSPTPFPEISLKVVPDALAIMSGVLAFMTKYPHKGSTSSMLGT